MSCRSSVLALRSMLSTLATTPGTSPTVRPNFQPVTPNSQPLDLQGSSPASEASELSRVICQLITAGHDLAEMLSKARFLSC